MTYQTQPGTVPHRVIAHLRTLPAGATVSTADLCEALGVDDGAVISASMGPARKAGLVTGGALPGKGRTFWWSLGAGRPEPDLDDDDKPVQRRVPAAEAKPLEIPRFATNAFGGPLKPVVVVTRPDPQDVFPGEPGFPAAGTAPEPTYVVEKINKPRQPFDAWLSGKTGAMVLVGVVLDEDGEVTLDAHDVQVLRNVLGVAS